MTRNNRGRLMIPARIISEDLDKAATLFRIIDFVPVRAEHLYISEEISYDGYSPYFREIEAGEFIPEYEMEISYDRAGWPGDVVVKERKLK